MKKKNNILIFNNSFFEWSETFIHSQISPLLNDFQFHLMGRKLLNQKHYNLSLFKIKIVGFYFNNYDKIKTKILRCLKLYRLPFSLYYTKVVHSYLVQENIELIHAHFGQNALTILPYAKKSNTKLIVTFHGYDASKLLNETWYSSRINELLNYCSHIIVVSPHMISKLSLENFLHKVSVIPCGINTKKFTPNSVKLQNPEINLLHSGRLTEKKGVPDLIKAFNKVLQFKTDVKLHILGDGPELSKCKSLVKLFNIENQVMFYGAQPHQKVKDLMETSDIFILNSRIASNGDMEGSPVSLLEAMSLEKAVISTNHAGIPSLITNHENGILIGENSQQELVDAMLLLINDGTLRKHLGLNARKTVQRNFDEDYISRKIENIYKQLLTPDSHK